MRSKRYQEIKKIIDSKKEYTIEEAIEIIKKASGCAFDESIEVHLKLGIDPKKSEQAVKGSVILPYGDFYKKKIAAFVEPEKEKEAKEGGADIVGGKDLIEKIKAGEKIDFDIAVASVGIMNELLKIAKILGPKGLMPSPKTGTLTQNIKETIRELKKGKISFKNDEGGNIHQIIGKISWDKEKIIANFKSFIEAVRKAKPHKIKGIFIKNVTLCSTMGPGIKIKI